MIYLWLNNKKNFYIYHNNLYLIRIVNIHENYLNCWIKREKQNFLEIPPPPHTIAKFAIATTSLNSMTM